MSCGTADLQTSWSWMRCAAWVAMTDSYRGGKAERCSMRDGNTWDFRATQGVPAHSGSWNLLSAAGLIGEGGSAAFDSCRSGHVEAVWKVSVCWLHPFLKPCEDRIWGRWKHAAESPHSELHTIKLSLKGEFCSLLILSDVVKFPQNNKI